MKSVLPLLLFLATATAMAADQGSRTPPKPPREMSAEMKAAFESCKESGKPGRPRLTAAWPSWVLPDRRAPPLAATRGKGRMR